MIDQKKCFAEVIESSLNGWLAQSWQWDVTPAFGSLVAIEHNKKTIFGIVHQVQTGSMDPTRYPFPYQKTEEELRAEQPQIFEFLKTTFSCITIGYQEKGKIQYLMSPEPPKIHSFVYYPSNDLTKIFFAHTRYLNVLFTHASTIFNIDELILALLKQHNHLAQFSHASFSTFMHTYALLVGNDYRRMKLFLQRAEHIISPNS